MFNPDIDIIIQQPDEIKDGKQTYKDVPARGRVIDFAQCDLDYFGTIQNGKIILVAPPEIPRLPGRIVVDGITYDLKSVKICRDLSGKLCGCRCAVQVIWKKTKGNGGHVFIAEKDNGNVFFIDPQQHGLPEQLDYSECFNNASGELVYIMRLDNLKFDDYINYAVEISK